MYLSQHHDNNNQSSNFLSLKEKSGPDYDVQYIASTGWFKQFKNHYPVRVKVSDDSVSADAKEADKILESKQTDYGERLLARTNIQYGGNLPILETCLKKISFIRGPSQCQVLKILRTA